MATPTNFPRVVLSRTLTAATILKLALQSDAGDGTAVTYNSILIEQTFKSVLIQNRTAAVLLLALDRVPPGNFTAAGDGIVALAAGATYVEDGRFKLIRLYSTPGGSVDIVLSI